MADSTLYETSEKDRLIKRTTKHSAEKHQLNEVEEAWMLLSEELEEV